MSALAPGLPQLTATVGTCLQTLAEGVVVAHPCRDEITHAEAVALTGEIRARLVDLAAMVTAVGHLVTAAWAMRADRALGYASWEDYCRELFADVRSTRLPVQTRRAVVAALRGAGMSTRAAASALGVGHKTVARDLQAGATASGDTVAGSTAPGTVVGLDGRRRAAGGPRGAGRRTARIAEATAPGEASQSAPMPPVAPVAPEGRPKTLRALEALAGAEDGLTWAELSTSTGWHHGIASATLSRLHAAGRIERSEQRRGGCAVYRLPVARVGSP